MWQWKAAAASAGLARAPLIWRPWAGIPVGGWPRAEGSRSAGCCVLPARAHTPTSTLPPPFAQCCFSTLLLSAHIHSRPTEPAELWESTATYGISGNLKILASAIVLHTKYSVNRVHPTPTDVLLPVGLFFIFFFQMQLNSFPRPYCCLPLSNLFSLLFISFPFCPKYIDFFFFFFSKEKMESKGAPNWRGRIWAAANEQVSAAIFTSSQEVPVAWAQTSLTGPFRSAQKNFCRPTTFFFFSDPFFTHSCLAQAACCRQPCWKAERRSAEWTLRFPGQGKKKDVMLRPKKGSEWGQSSATTRWKDQPSTNQTDRLAFWINYLLFFSHTERKYYIRTTPPLISFYNFPSVRNYWSIFRHKYHFCQLKTEIIFSQIKQVQRFNDFNDRPTETFWLWIFASSGCEN